MGANNNFGQGQLFGFGSSGGGGGGGALTAADNGLSVSGTTVQLGQAIGALGDPAELLMDTEVPFNGNGLSFVDRTSGATISFDPMPQVFVELFTNSVDFNNNAAFKIANTQTNFEIMGDIGSDIAVTLPSTDVITLQSAQGRVENNLIFFPDTGNFQFSNTNTGGPVADSGVTVQVLGSLQVDNSITTASLPITMSIAAGTDAGGNTTQLTVDGLGNYGWSSFYGGTNGGQFRGFVTLVQQINFNSPSESQQTLSTNTNMNWDNNLIGEASIIGFNEIQVQFNLNDVGDANPAQIVTTSGGSYYGAGLWMYRGMNPTSTGNPGFGALTIVQDGDQGGTTRPQPLGMLSIRTDFNNGGTVTVTGQMANFVSDLALGAPGHIIGDFIDFSAGGGFNNTSGGFLVDRRIAFWAQNLSASQNTTLGYAFRNEGASDFNYFAGHTQIGGADAAAMGGYGANLFVNGTLSWQYFPFATADAVTNITTNDESGLIFSDEGSSTTGAVLNLPAASPGLHYYFVVINVAMQVNRNGSSSDVIMFNSPTTGTSLKSVAVGSFLHLICVLNAVWTVASSVGTWTLT